MSQANAAARKRRAGGATLQDNGVPAQTNNILQQQSPKGGLTLPQVISLVDKRLITLETFMKETQSGGSQSNGPSSAATTSASEDAVNSMADEFDTKFAVLAQEVADLKDIVLKLQAYTMEVNRTMYEERIHVLSDMGQPKDDRIDFHISDDEVGGP
jgi:predicted ATP-dependent endonuclease of OLD family